jgi:hypothetical protein
MNSSCNHDKSALRDHVCCDCIIEVLYNHPITSLHTIMWAGPLNVWRPALGVFLAPILYLIYRLNGKYRYSPTKVPVLSFAGALP